MKYKITAIKRQQIAKKDGSGTWTKIQVKTDKTGDQILDLGFSFPRGTKENLKAGDILTGYVETKTWESNGKSGVNTVLNGITAEYVYELLLRTNPDIEKIMPSDSVEKSDVTPSEWETVDVSEEDIDEEAGF